MKTKTLLVAVAALAAATISSQAQVYSQNIVGYANVITPNIYQLLANPLTNSAGNSLTNILAGVPKGTQVLLWNGASYNSYTKNAITGAWPAGAGTNNLDPGVGFFLKVPILYTNTFVGEVVGSAAGGTNSLPLAGGVYQLVGSPVPLGGTVNSNGPAALNLGATLSKGSQILAWNGSSYNSATKNAITGVWNTNLPVNIGQGIFVKPGLATNWVQTLQ